MNGRSTIDNLLQLPDEMMEHIFSNLNVRSMLTAQSVCSLFYNRFVSWGKNPVPNREIYLCANINRAAALLDIANKSPLHVLLLGSRSMQANIISRPIYFFEDNILQLEDEEDYVSLPQYKLRIFSSLSDGLTEVNIVEQIQQSHLLLLCVSNKEDYKTRLESLIAILDKLEKRPLIFIGIQSRVFFETIEYPAEKVIALSPEVKRDGVARLVMERLILLANIRQEEMKSLIKMS